MRSQAMSTATSGAIWSAGSSPMALPAPTVRSAVENAVFSLDNAALRIGELTTLNQAEIAAIQTRVSQRVLRWFLRRGWLDPDDARAMRDWHNDGGFSLDAAVRISAWDRAGLDRRLGDIARPQSRTTIQMEKITAADAWHRFFLSTARCSMTAMSVEADLRLGNAKVRFWPEAVLRLASEPGVRKLYTSPESITPRTTAYGRLLPLASQRRPRA